MSEDNAGAGQVSWDAMVQTLPEELRTAPFVKKFNSFEGVVKSGMEAERGAFWLPKDDAAPEEFEAKLFSKIRPKDPNDYDLPEVEGGAMDEALLKEFRAKAHANGLHGKQARGIYDWFNGEMKARRDAAQKASDEATAALLGEWGADAERNLALAERGFEESATPELRELLDKSGLRKHPLVLDHFLKIGRGAIENAAPGAAPQGESAESLQREIDAIRKSAEYNSLDSRVRMAAADKLVDLTVRQMNIRK